MNFDGKLFLIVFIGFVLANVSCKVEESTSFFNTDNADRKDVCDGDKCDGNAKSKVDKHTNAASESDSATDDEINVIITFTNAANKWAFHDKFRLTVSSLLQHASIPLAIHIIGDPESQDLAEKIIAESTENMKRRYRTVKLDVDKLARDLDAIITPMQKHFSFEKGAYYSHALFFLSIAIHQVLPESIHRVIMLDADLKFMDDIRNLYDRFELFTSENIIGVGRELQPVYRHTFWAYRKKHLGTRVGEPPPNGLTGFNSGVLLLDLDRMRQSELYNSLLNEESLARLTEELSFKGHLGDQDFFTMLGMKYEQLFHILPCEWNRQLCRWWEDKGYADVFDLYYRCDADVSIYHGNCNTPIP